MTGPARRASGSRRTPTEAEILDAALALLDAGGLAGASIRRGGSLTIQASYRCW